MLTINILGFRHKRNEARRSFVVPNAAGTTRSERRGGQAGGSAMQGGARYQNQVTAWLTAKMLAERPAAPLILRGKLTYIASESGEAVDGHTGRNGPGQFRVRSGQAEDFAFNARGRGPRRRRESGRSANCGHGRAGQAPLVENPETQCGPPAAGDIVGFPGDDQNQSAKCTPSGEQTTSRPNSSGCGKEPRGESCLSRFRPRDAA